MKKILILISLFSFYFANSQSKYYVTIPSTGEKFTAKEIKQEGEKYILNGVEKTDFIVPDPKEGDLPPRDFAGTFNNIEYHGPQIVIHCLTSSSVCFSIPIIKPEEDPLGGDSKFLVEIDNKLYVTNSIPEVNDNNAGKLIKFNSEKVLTKSKKELEDEGNFIGPPRFYVFGTHSNWSVAGTYYTVDCITSTDVCFAVYGCPTNIDLISQK